METKHLIAGTPEWHTHRATHFNASDAPAMLGCSPYMTRTELLHKLHTGLPAEHDAATERRFADGHRFEALARPLAEEIIGDDLAPVVGTLGELSASFDGLTMMGDTAFEHKSMNDDLRSVMHTAGTPLPKHYRAQMEQQLLVSGAERVLFMASKWDGDTPVEEQHCWYTTDPALRAEIIAGWKQFAADLAAYKPAEAAAPVTAAPIEALPALSVQMQGSLAVHSNLDLFGAKLREFVARIPVRPDTEQEFADCDAACKALKRAEEALDGAEASALGQVQSVEQVTRAIADLRTIARTARLASEKMVKARKEQIRTEEVQRGKDALAAHIAYQNAAIGKPYMPAIPADFAGAISGKKTVDSVRNAIDTELARAKIAANEISSTILVNMAMLRETASAHTFLFADTAALVLKAPDDCRAVVAGRIAEHQAAEAKKEADTRERIRAEEQAKAEREAREKMLHEQAEAARQELAAAKQNPEGATLSPAAQALNEQMGEARMASMHRGMPAPALANVVPMGTRAPVDTRPPFRLGQIGDKLGFTLTADFLKQLGFEPAATEKAAKLYRASDEALIYEALIAHIRTVAAKQLRAA